MTTRTDSELKSYCFNALARLVGHVEMERFIVLLNREPRDYTKWRDSIRSCRENQGIYTSETSREKSPTHRKTLPCDQRRRMRNGLGRLPRPDVTEKERGLEYGE